MQEIKEATLYRAVLKQRIMDTAMMLFGQQGIKAVKMHDIAKQLGISKRTLYEIYTDKEELLYQGVVAYDQKKREHLSEYASTANNVIEVIVEAYRMKVREVHTVNPVFYEDILKYPKVEAYIKDMHERRREGFISFMQRGVDEGCLRPDVDYVLFQIFLDSIGKNVMENQLVKKYSVGEIFGNLFLVIIRGLCTIKGLALLEKALAAKNQ